MFGVLLVDAELSASRGSMTKAITQNLRRQSEERLIKLRTELESKLDVADPTKAEPRVCIYATGSLARLEANPSSDLDAFFFLTGESSDKNSLSRIRDVKILNSVLDASHNCKFPDFSNNGEYLKFLHVEDVVSHIGGREDDYHNALTARMLLMLESKFLFNESLFNEFRARIVERYFIDFHKHNDEFKPIFLLNDILRFWRTMCLNYEHSREWRNADNDEKWAKGHLANLKLRFSRLNICFSFIAKMLAHGPNISQAQVIEVASLTPLERLEMLSERGAHAKEQISILMDEYHWFLESVGKPKTEVLNWIADKEMRKKAFAHSDKFVHSMYTLVSKIAEESNYMRFLVI
jgi:hypothetical protein